MKAAAFFKFGGDRQGIPLRTLLIVPFVVQVVGMTSLVGYLSYRSGHRAVDDLAHQLMTATGDRLTDDLNDYLQTPHRLNQINAAALASGVISLQHLDQLQQYLFWQLQQFPEITTLLVGTPAGGFRTIHRVDPREIDLGLSLIQPTDLPYEAGRNDPRQPSRLNLYSIASSGALDRPLEAIEDIDVRQRPWYRRAVTTGKPGWSEPFQIGSSNLLALNAFHPVYDQAGELQGILSVNVSLNHLHGFLKDLPLSQSGQAFIVDRDGLLLATSTTDPAYVVSGTLAPGTGSAPAPVTRPGTLTFYRLGAADSENPITRGAYQQLRQRFGDLKGIQAPQGFSTRLAEQSYYLYVTPYQDGHGLDWLLVMAVPESAFTAAIQANAQRTLLLSGLALVGSIGLGLWIVRRVTQTLGRLNQATQRYGAAETPPPPAPAGIRELDALQHNFAQMMAEVDTRKAQAESLHQDYARTLEQQVADQTRALRETTAQLQEAQRIAQVGSWEFDITTGKITWSEELFRIYGLDPSQPEPSYTDYLACIPEPERQTLQALVATAIAQGTPYEVEHRIIRPDGSQRYIVGRGEACYSAEGQVIKLTGTGADITQRKQIELALQDNEARLRMALEVSGAIAWEHDLQTNQVTYLGKATQFSLYTIPYAEALSRVHPDDRARLRQATEQALAGAGSFQVEHRVLAPGNPPEAAPEAAPPWRWVQVNAGVITDTAGTPIQIAGMSIDITERKQLDLALQESETRLSNILNSASAAITRMQIFADQRWQILHVSDGSEAISGFTSAELTEDQQLWVSRIHPQDRETIFPRVFADIFAERASTHDYRFYDRNGQLRWISQTNHSRWDPDQACWAVTAVSLDVSDRKRAEAALASSQAALVEAQRVAHIGNWELDVATYRITWSEELFRMFGLDPRQPEPTYDAFMALIHPEDRAALQGAVDRAFAEGRPYTIDYRALQPDGSIRYHEGRGRVEQDGEGRVVRLFGTALDITVRKQAELGLQETNHRQRAILSVMPDLIYIVARDGQVLEQVTTRPEMDLFPADADLTQINVFEVGTPAQIERKRQALAAALASGQIQLYEQQITVQGRQFHEEVRCIPMSEERVMLVFRDISNRKQAELELQRAKEAAEAANQAKSRFIANISHELRSPLHGILGFARIIKGDLQLPADHREHADIIEHSGEHLLSIINQVLDMAKIEAHQATLTPSRVSLVRLRQDLKQLFDLKAESRDLDFVIDWDPALPEAVYTDNMKLRQVLINLLDNAFKFTRQGGVTLTATSLTGVNGQGPMLQFAIADTGPGIAPEEQSLLFKPFSQTQSSQGIHSSTGLGLAISQEFVRLMGGVLSVTSQPDQGSVFQFTIAAQPPPAPDPSPPVSRRRVIGLGPDQPTYRLLVVDDSIVNRRLLTHVLATLKVDIQQAENGQEALQIWQSWRPHAILMDLRMPVMDGYSAARQIRQQESTVPLPRTILIAVSATGTQLDIDAEPWSDFDGYILKPFKTQDIFDTLHTLLGCQYQYAEPASP